MSKTRKETRLLEAAGVLVQHGMLERSTVLLQKPFTAEETLKVIREMHVSVQGQAGFVFPS